MTRISQSVSKIHDWFLCNQKYYRNYITKEIKFIETPQTKKGKEIHYLLERLLSNQSVLDTELTLLSNENLNYLNRLLSSDGEVFTEYKFGIDVNHKAVKIENNWDKQSDGEPFLMIGSMDLRITNGAYTTIVDWKTGKDYADTARQDNIIKMVEHKTLQLDSYAMTEFLLNPDCQFVKCVYYFLPTDTLIELYYERSELPALVNMILGIVGLINSEVEKWSTTQPLSSITQLCGWCGYKDRCEVFIKNGSSPFRKDV